MNGKDHREWRRIEVNIPAEGKILPASGAAVACRVVNLNPDGLCFAAPETVRSGDAVSLLVDLKGEGPTRVQLKVAWAGWFEAFGEYRAGGRFDGTAVNEKRKFLRFYHVKLMSSLGG